LIDSLILLLGAFTSVTTAYCIHSVVARLSVVLNIVHGRHLVLSFSLSDSTMCAAVRYKCVIHICLRKTRKNYLFNQ